MSRHPPDLPPDRQDITQATSIAIAAITSVYMPVSTPLMLFLSLAQCPCAAGKATEAKAVDLTTKQMAM